MSDTPRRFVVVTQSIVSVMRVPLTEDYYPDGADPAEAVAYEENPENRSDQFQMLVEDFDLSKPGNAHVVKAYVEDEHGNRITNF